MDNMKTGAVIKQLRKEKGLTQLQLANMLHVTDRAVSKWERGLCTPDIALLEPLSKILGVSIVELIEGELQDTPSQTEATAITVIDYSSHEIKAKVSKNRRTLYICIGLMVLVLCIVFASMLISRVHQQKMDEASWMNHMYAKLRDIAEQADYILRDDLTPEAQSRVFLDLYYALKIAADELEIGSSYVADCVPSAAAWWFDERAAVISNYQQAFLTAEGNLSVFGKAYLEQLNQDMRELIDPLMGEDQMNFNNELSIEAFSAVIFDFYYSDRASYHTNRRNPCSAPSLISAVTMPSSGTMIPA